MTQKKPERGRNHDTQQTATLKPKSLKEAFALSLEEVAWQYSQEKQRSVRLDKLGQLVTPLISNKLEKRAKSKHFGTRMALGLVNLVSPLQKGYWRTYNCSDILNIEGQKVKTQRFCKARWCPTCSRIQTGIMLNRFMPVFPLYFPNPYLVTLTARNVKGQDLKEEVDRYLKTLGNIVRTIKANLKRKGQLEDLKGLRKLEITWNATRNDFHPHFHLVVNSEEIANEFKRLWLRANPTKAKEDAQDIRKANEESLKEIFKYLTKLTFKNKTTGKKSIYPPYVLDTIFQALKNRRTFDTYQIPEINHEVEIPQEEILEDLQPVQEPRSYYYETAPYWNWYEVYTGQPLVEYKELKEVEDIFFQTKYAGFNASNMRDRGG